VTEDLRENFWMLDWAGESGRSNGEKNSPAARPSYLFLDSVQLYSPMGEYKEISLNAK